MKNIPTLLATLMLTVLSACATSQQLEVIPNVDGDTLPTFNSQKINPKSIMIEVTNLREVNQKAGNSAQVAAKVSDAMTQVVQKSGLSIGKSTNLLRVELQDCPPMKNTAGEEVKNSVCLKVKLTLLAGKLRYEGSATAENYAWTQTGNVNDAYKSALTTVIEGMNRKISE
jgi:hypothetical protein